MNNCKGIIISNIRFKDTSSISNIYTSEYGKLPFILKGIKNPKRKDKKVIFPFTIINFHFHKKESRTVQALHSFEAELYPLNIIGNPVKTSIVFFLSEVLNKVIKEEEKNEVLFNFLESSVYLLNDLEKGIANFHIFFLIHLSFYLGFMPLNNFSEQEKYFNLVQGKFVSSQIDSLSKDLSGLFYEFLISNTNEIKNIEINRSQRNNLLKAIWQYYQLHLPGLGEIKSLEVLISVFN